MGVCESFLDDPMFVLLKSDCKKMPGEPRG